MDHPVTDRAKRHIKNADESLQQSLTTVAEDLAECGDSVTTTDEILSLLKDTEGDIACCVRNVGGTVFFRWESQQEQFERIIRHSAPQSQPKHHRETPAPALKTYLRDCPAYTVHVLSVEETAFPAQPAADWIYKWPRHDNEHCVYGVVHDEGLETWYFERESSNTDAVTLVATHRWAGEDPYDLESTESRPSGDELPDSVVEKLTEQGFTYG